MDYVVRNGAPAALGQPGEVVKLTQSQAVYHRLRGHVAKPVIVPPVEAGVAGEGVEDVQAPRKRRRRKG